MLPQRCRRCVSVAKDCPIFLASGHQCLRDRLAPGQLASSRVPRMSNFWRHVDNEGVYPLKGLKNYLQNACGPIIDSITDYIKWDTYQYYCQRIAHRHVEHYVLLRSCIIGPRSRIVSKYTWTNAHEFVVQCNKEDT